MNSPKRGDHVRLTESGKSAIIKGGYGQYQFDRYLVVGEIREEDTECEKCNGLGECWAEITKRPDGRTVAPPCSGCRGTGRVEGKIIGYNIATRSNYNIKFVVVPSDIKKL